MCAVSVVAELLVLFDTNAVISQMDELYPVKTQKYIRGLVLG